MSEETREFVRELSRDLSPVERIGRLRVALSRSIGLWLAVTLLAVAAQGLSARMSDPATIQGGFGAILGGLLLMGFGGLVVGLASAVPGRDAAVRGGGGLLLAGAALALGLGAFLVYDPAAMAPRINSDLTCLTMACLVALLPVAGALLWVARAAPARPGATLLGAAVGCVALGAFTAQLGCADTSWRHLVVAHALAPPIGAAIFTLPLYLGFQRLRAR